MEARVNTWMNNYINAYTVYNHTYKYSTHRPTCIHVISLVEALI